MWDPYHLQDSVHFYKTKGGRGEVIKEKRNAKKKKYKIGNAKELSKKKTRNRTNGAVAELKAKKK